MLFACQAYSKQEYLLPEFLENQGAPILGGFENKKSGWLPGMHIYHKIPIISPTVYKPPGFLGTNF